MGAVVHFAIFVMNFVGFIIIAMPRMLPCFVADSIISLWYKKNDKKYIYKKNFRSL